VVDDLIGEEAVALDAMFVHQSYQALILPRIQLVDKVVWIGFLSIQTAAYFSQVFADAHSLFLLDQTCDTGLVEQTKFVVLLWIDFTEFTQIRLLTLALLALAGASFRAYFARGSHTGIGIPIAVAFATRPSVFANALAADTISQLFIAVQAFATLAKRTRISRITQASSAVTVPVIGANQFGGGFIRKRLTAFLEQSFIAGDICGICGTVAIGPSPPLIAFAHSAVQIALIIAQETSFLVFRIWCFLTGTRPLKLNIQIHELAQGGFLHPDFVCLKAKENEVVSELCKHISKRLSLN